MASHPSKGQMRNSLSRRVQLSGWKQSDNGTDATGLVVSDPRSLCECVLLDVVTAPDGAPGEVD